MNKTQAQKRKCELLEELKDCQARIDAAPELKKLEDEPWPDDKSLKFRFLKANGELWYTDTQPKFHSISNTWSTEMNVVWQYVSSGFDPANWQDSLQKRPVEMVTWQRSDFEKYCLVGAGWVRDSSGMLRKIIALQAASFFIVRGEMVQGYFYIEADELKFTMPDGSRFVKESQ